MTLLTKLVFSSQAVEVQKLEDSRNSVLSSKWTDKTAGGCHLYDRQFESKSEKFTWVNNPKFHLQLQTQEKERVKITLSRPERSWKKTIAQSPVGCMIGFYVYKGSVQPSKETILNQNKFVPMNEISETVELDGHPDGYIIMPSTYESGKQGNFIISVATDCDFNLVPLD